MSQVLPFSAAYPADPLSALMRRVVMRDRIALAELYTQTAPKLFGMLLRMTKDRARAEDILQDTYIKIWERAAQFQADKGSVIGWMITIARNHALDDIRKHARLVSSETIPGFDNLAAIDAQTFDAVPQRHDPGALLRCLEKLEEVKKDMILLAYQHGFSRDELAKRFDTPVATIKTWLRRSLATLRACMTTHG